MQPGSGFPRQLRLTDASQFSLVLATATQRVRAGAFIALVLPNGGLLARLGMIIARRHTRTAVRRNRIKRLIREGFRQRQAQFLGLDIVVMLRSRAEADSTRHLAQLWQELQTCCAPGLSP